MMAQSKSQSIGIDLGTTFCCVAAHRNFNPKLGRDPFPEVIQNSLGINTTPSYVNYEDEGDISVGQTAKDLSNENPENTIFDVKRLMGRSFYDLHVTEYNRNKLWPFHLVNYKGLVGVTVREKTLLPQEIAAELIKHLVDAAQAYLGCQIDSAVVTVPTYYSSLQKELTREACAIAGLHSVQLITEPHAAAFAYGLHFSRNFNGPKTCFIFDLGGGTFDVTVFTLGAGNQVEIKGVGGDPKLGGEDFNDLLTEYCINEFNKMTGVDLTEGKLSEDPTIRLRTARRLRRVRNECEKQKCYLSAAQRVHVSLDGLHSDHVMHVLVTRTIFENLIAGYLARCMDIITSVLRGSNVGVDEIDDVVLIGGSSRIPKVKELVQKYFGGKRFHTTIDPDEAVACGAAIYAKNHFQSPENSFIENNITVVDKFNDENAALTSRIQRGEEEILRLINELRKAQKAEPKLENLKATEIEMTKYHKSQLHYKEGELKEAQTLLDKQKDFYEMQIEDLKKKVMEADIKLICNSNEVKRLEGLQKDLTTKNQVLQMRTETLSRQIEDQKVELEVKTIEFNSFKSDGDDQAEMLEVKLLNCQDEMDRLQLRLESALFELNQKHRELEKVQQRQNSHAEEFSVQILKLENTVADKEVICKMLREEIAGKENLNLNLRDGLNKADADLTDLIKQGNEAKIGLIKENEALKSKISSLERSVDAVTNELCVKMKQLLEDIQN